VKAWSLILLVAVAAGCSSGKGDVPYDTLPGTYLYDVAATNQRLGQSGSAPASANWRETMLVLQKDWKFVYEVNPGHGKEVYKGTYELGGSGILLHVETKDGIPTPKGDDPAYMIWDLEHFSMIHGSSVLKRSDK
jgi:hypothetical protein